MCAGRGLQTPGATTTSLRPAFTWTPAAGATTYEIHINNESTGVARFHIATVTGTSYTPNVDLALGRYRMWIRSVIGATPGNWTPPFSFSILATPIWKSISRVQLTSQPALEWNPLPGANKYDLWIDNQSTGQKQFVRTEVTGTTWTPANELPMGLYRCWIRGVDAKGNAGTWSVLQELLIVPAPSPVGPLSATFDRTPTFVWTAISGAVSYELYVKNLNTNAMVINGQSVAGTSFTPASNLSDGTYRWWAFAVSSPAIGSIKSGGSNPTVIYVGGRPTFISPAAGSTNSDRTPTIAWNAVDGDASYQLQVNRTDIAQFNVINQTGLTVTSFIPSSDLVPGTYRAWVRAVSNTSELSAWSVPLDFSITHSEPDLDAWDFETLIAELLLPESRSHLGHKKSLKVSPSLSKSPQGEAASERSQSFDSAYDSLLALNTTPRSTSTNAGTETQSEDRRPPLAMS